MGRPQVAKRVADNNNDKRKEELMGRGDRARVRWAHDRERRKKAAEKRKAAEAGRARKAAGKR
jgi:hypothetical protein